MARDKEAARQLLDQERERLVQLRNELAGQVAEEEAGAAEELSSIDQHPAEIGTEVADRERDLSVLEQVDGELADVDDAYSRLEDGTYGLCEICGKPIGDDRLEALPAARRCTEHQALAEQSPSSEV